MKELDDLHAAHLAYQEAVTRCDHMEVEYDLVCNARIFVRCSKCKAGISSLEMGLGDISDEWAKKYAESCKGKRSPIEARASSLPEQP